MRFEMTPPPSSTGPHATKTAQSFIDCRKRSEKKRHARNNAPNVSHAPPPRIFKAKFQDARSRIRTRRWRGWREKRESAGGEGRAAFSPRFSSGAYRGPASFRARARSARRRAGHERKSSAAPWWRGTRRERRPPRACSDSRKRRASPARPSSGRGRRAGRAPRPGGGDPPAADRRASTDPRSRPAVALPRRERESSAAPTRPECGASPPRRRQRTARAAAVPMLGLRALHQKQNRSVEDDRIHPRRQDPVKGTSGRRRRRCGPPLRIRLSRITGCPVGNRSLDLEVAIHDVVENHRLRGVLLRLQVALDLVFDDRARAAVLEELQVAVDQVPGDVEGALPALDHL